MTTVGAAQERRRMDAPCLRNTRALKPGDELVVSEAVKKCVELKKPEGMGRVIKSGRRHMLILDQNRVCSFVFL